MRQDFGLYEAPLQPRSRILENLPMIVAGLMLIVAFAFAGNLIGRNASAHNADGEELASMVMDVAPTSALSTKGSLLPEGQSFTAINLDALRRQTVITDGKGDLTPATEVVPAVAAPMPKAKPANFAKLAAAQKNIKIIPASVDLQNEDNTPAPAVKRIVSNPALPTVSASVAPAQKQQIVAQRRVRLAEENCLARAVYFESRSESDIGQLAVAKVILNRVKSPDFPKTICGVVYQGSGSRNSCQFSFACDGLPDDVKSPEAWAHAKMIAERAINNDPAISMLGNAVNYHADYVTPRWSRTMKRLIRIGHHIFYAQRNQG
ncbi:MAG: cell wall hydrolase [Alphaproteobacteria bacterium]|nr:cell wall hydrolase [Alphaproteobacteria bacterium]